MANKFFKPCLCLTGLALFFLFFVFLNQVQASIGLSIQPVKVSHTINPEESVSGVISISNVSDEEVRVETELRDFVPMAGTYGIQFVGRAPGLTTVIDWMSLDAPKSFILGKSQARDVVYTIRAPKNAEPGGHFGTIFFKATDPKASGQLRVGTQVGMLVFVTVPGPNLQKGKILDFSGPKFVPGPKKLADILKRRTPAVNFAIKFENTGTVHFDPRGTVKITKGKKEVAEVAVAGQIVLPTGVRDISADWLPQGLLLGNYKAKAQMVDGEGNELTTGEISFFAFPLWFVLSFAALVGAIFFGFRFLRKKVKFSVSLKQ